MSLCLPIALPVSVSLHLCPSLWLCRAVSSVSVSPNSASVSPVSSPLPLSLPPLVSDSPPFPPPSALPHPLSLSLPQPCSEFTFHSAEAARGLFATSSSPLPAGLGFWQQAPRRADFRKDFPPWFSTGALSLGPGGGLAAPWLPEAPGRDELTASWLGFHQLPLLELPPLIFPRGPRGRILRVPAAPERRNAEAQVPRKKSTFATDHVAGL